MSLSLITAAVARVAEETAKHEPAINPWFIGALALGILLAMLFALMAFGGGREHS